MDSNLAAKKKRSPLIFMGSIRMKKIFRVIITVREIYTNNDETPYLLAYESYGYQKNSNRFRKIFGISLWETQGIPDWRLELGIGEGRTCIKNALILMQEEAGKQIRYFSLWKIRM